VVEHPFGTVKYLAVQIPILLRGKTKVQIEMDPYSTACSLKRMLTVETVPELLEQLALWLPVPAFLSVFFRFCSQKTGFVCPYRYP
jgi:hypothetical protein